MKTKIISILPAGHGHNRVTIETADGREYSAVTDQTYLTDQYRRETFSRKGEREKRRADRALINIVKSKNKVKQDPDFHIFAGAYPLRETAAAEAEKIRVRDGVMTRVRELKSGWYVYVAKTT